MAVYYSVDDWLDVLTCYGLAMGFCLAGMGLACTLLGWRVSRFVVAGDYLVAGILVGIRVGGQGWSAWLLGPVLGLALMAASWVYPRYAARLIAALLGAYCAGACVVHLEGSPPPVLIAGVIGFLVVGALSIVLHEHVVVILTSAQGAALFVAGVVILMYAHPAWYGGFHALAIRSNIFMPMVIAGLTGIGVFFQLAEIQEERSSQVST